MVIAEHAPLMLPNARIRNQNRSETEDQGSGEAGHKLKVGKIQAIQHPGTRAMVPMARREPEGKA